MKKADLIGQRFGRLVVISFHSSTRNGHSRWLCSCECGNEKAILATHLVSGKILSCGCYNQENRGRSQSKYVGLISGHFWYNHIVRSATGVKGRRNPVLLTLTKEEAWALFEKQEGKCALSGLPIFFPEKMGQNYSASLDRIDSSRGYESENVQWVHKDINMMKRMYDQDYFVKMCSLVARKRERDEFCIESKNS